MDIFLVFFQQNRSIWRFVIGFTMVYLITQLAHSWATQAWTCLNHPLPNFEAGGFTPQKNMSVSEHWRENNGKKYISNDYHDYLLIHHDLSALCSDAFWNFYRGGLWTALPRPSTWHDAPVSSAHSERSSSEWTGDWRKLHGGYPTNLFFFTNKMDQDGFKWTMTWYTSRVSRNLLMMRANGTAETAPGEWNWKILGELGVLTSSQGKHIEIQHYDGDIYI